MLGSLGDAATIGGRDDGGGSLVRGARSVTRNGSTSSASPTPSRELPDARDLRIDLGDRSNLHPGRWILSPER